MAAALHGNLWTHFPSTRLDLVAPENPHNPKKNMQWSNAENMTGACISNMKPQRLSVLKAHLLKWGNVLETFSYGFPRCIGTVLKLQRCQPSLRREIGQLSETPSQSLASLYSGQELKRNPLNQPHKVSQNVRLTMALRDFLVWSNPFVYRWGSWDLGGGVKNCSVIQLVVGLGLEPETYNSQTDTLSSIHIIYPQIHAPEFSMWFEKRK